MGVDAGKKGAVYISTSGSGEASSVAKLTNWTLDMTTDKLDVTAFQDGNKTYVQSWKDSKGTFKGFWDDTEDKMWDGADSADGVKMYLYPSTDAPTKYFYGPAWLDVSIEVDVNGTVSVSGNFSANGTWGQQM
jgi:hypothetical protein